LPAVPVGQWIVLGASILVYLLLLGLAYVIAG
jgi:hypothetical protein